MTSGDVGRDERAASAVALAHIAAFRAQSKVDKAHIADQEALQAQELVEIQRVLSGLADCLTPALDAVLGWLFALDLEAGAGILEQEEGSRPCQDIGRDGRDDLLRAAGEVSREKSVQDLGTKHQGAELRCSGKIVADAVARRALARSGELELGIEDVGKGGSLCVREVEGAVGKPLVEEPDPAGVRAGRLASDQGGDGVVADGQEQALEDKKIDALPLESKGQVGGEGVLGAVPGGQEAPVVRGEDLVALTDRGEAMRQGDVKAVGVD